MMRRRFYGGEVLEAIPLVAPVHEDGTYLTPDEIAAQLGSVNIIDKFNQSGIPNKLSAYTISEDIAEFTITSYTDDNWYYETANGIETAKKYKDGELVTPISGSKYRYVITASDTPIYTNVTSNAVWLFLGKSIGIRCTNNKSIKYIHVNNREISDLNFNGCTSISGSIFIHKGNSYPANCFLRCENLTRVEFDGTIEDWCNMNFLGTSYTGYTSNPLYYAHNLYIQGNVIKDLVIPESVSIIKNQVFAGCNFTSLDLGNVTEVGENSFNSCQNYSTLIIPPSLTRIKLQAFRNNRVTSIDIQSQLESIETGVFAENLNLPSIQLPSTIKIIDYVGFYSCSLFTSIELPIGIETLGNQSFQGTNIQSFNIPQTIKSIGYSIMGIPGVLTDVFMNWETDDDIITFNKQWQFAYRTYRVTLHVPLGTIEKYINKGYLYERTVDDEGDIISENNAFYIITDGETTVTWDTYQPTT